MGGGVTELVTERVHRRFKIGRFRVEWTRLKHKGHLPTRHVWQFHFVFDEPWPWSK